MVGPDGSHTSWQSSFDASASAAPACESVETSVSDNTAVLWPRADTGVHHLLTIEACATQPITLLQMIMAVGDSLAILIPPDVRAHLDAAVAPHRDDVLRWTGVDSWHSPWRSTARSRTRECPPWKSRLTRAQRRDTRHCRSRSPGEGSSAGEPSGLDARAISRRCGRSPAQLRPPVGESARRRTKVDSRPT